MKDIDKNFLDLPVEEGSKIITKRLKKKLTRNSNFDPTEWSYEVEDSSEYAYCDNRGPIRD